MTSTLQNAVARVLHPCLPDEAGLSVEQLAQLLESPRDAKLGDLAFPCFRLAKTLRKGPPVIAKDLAESLSESLDPTAIVQHAVATGPYLNVAVNLSAAAAAVLPDTATLDGDPPPHRGEKVMVEFSQPNTHKAFHVGHMRNVSLGDALVRLLRADGYEVVAANYLGDVGAHIAKCLWWFLDHLDDAGRTPPDTGRGEWLGTVYSAASNKLDEWEKAAKTGDGAAQSSLDAARARTTDILQKLEAREPDMQATWSRTRQWSLDEFNEIYAWAGVAFDRVFFESEVDEPGLALVQEFFDKGVFVESEGAVGIFNEEVKHMPFFMLRKRDGTSLYSTKDLALARLKFEEHQIDRSIYVVDVRQSDHFRHVFLTLAKMGFEQASKCEHVPYEMVELPEGAMSTRKGTVILFRALRERMLEHIETAYLGKYRGEWDEAELAETAHALALGAIRYGMLSRDVNQKIVFDLEAWLNLEGNTGPYIQYSAARVASILRKAELRDKTLDPALLRDRAQVAQVATALDRPEERELVLALDNLRPAMHQAAQALRPSLLCTYLHGLAKSVNRFATSRECKVIDQEGDRLQARLLLMTSAYAALRWGLIHLGIPTPNRM